MTDRYIITRTTNLINQLCTEGSEHEFLLAGHYIDGALDKFFSKRRDLAKTRLAELYHSDIEQHTREVVAQGFGSTYKLTDTEHVSLIVKVSSPSKLLNEEKLCEALRSRGITDVDGLIDSCKVAAKPATSLITAAR